MNHTKIIIIVLILSATSWLYRVLFCPEQIEFHPGDALAEHDIFGRKVDD